MKQPQRHPRRLTTVERENHETPCVRRPLHRRVRAFHPLISSAFPTLFLLSTKCMLQLQLPRQDGSADGLDAPNMHYWCAGIHWILNSTLQETHSLLFSGFFVSYGGRRSCQEFFRIHMRKEKGGKSLNDFFSKTGNLNVFLDNQNTTQNLCELTLSFWYFYIDYFLLNHSG